MVSFLHAVSAVDTRNKKTDGGDGKADSQYTSLQRIHDTEVRVCRFVSRMWSV